MNEQPPPEAVVLRALKELVKLPTARDEQRTIGPSDMADPCARCLAHKMAGTPIPRADDTIFTWFGTGIHHHLEGTIERITGTPVGQLPESARFAQQFFTGALPEVEVLVCEIPGYGTVKGHIDVLGRTVVDWKSLTTKKLLGYKKDLAAGKVPQQLQTNMAQLTLYIGAARRVGYNIETGVLAFIPRDAVTVNDFWTYPVRYSEANEQALIQRTKDIFEYVKVGRHGEIASDPDCYTCHPRYYG